MSYLKQIVRRLLGRPAIKSKEELQQEKFNDLMDAMKDFEEMYKKH
ncbi:hypothetical protein [Pseudomonas sp. Fl4BN1]|nr:hypothetical protein [Pseudomonas sp. Fl4BN1]NBF13090.1 hypothetical protein [Pseudomonas sp. Fl4BN1]